MNKENAFHLENPSERPVTQSSETNSVTQPKEEDINEKQARIQDLLDEIEVLQNRPKHIKGTHDSYGIPLENFKSQPSDTKDILDPETRAYFYPEEENDEDILRRKQEELRSLKKDIDGASKESKSKRMSTMRRIRKGLYTIFQFPFLK